jgi:Sigma-70, region 4
MIQQDIGDILGVSQMQVSRILRGAVARLREHARQREREPAFWVTAHVHPRAQTLHAGTAWASRGMRAAVVRG